MLEVRAVEVEQWLKRLCFEKGDPLAKGSKAKIRNIMSALYSHAIRWEWTTANPITSVRQSAKRPKIPEILTVDELVKLLDAIPEPFRTAVFLDGDVDFERNVIHIKRSIVSRGEATLLIPYSVESANGENSKVIQELLRHATLKVTMDTYVQAMSDEKRKAQSKVVEMIMPGIRKKAGR